MAERIVVGMSGGVDSSVAAALLVEQGFDVIGITLRVWPWREPEEATRKFGSCCSPESVDDARAVARRLRIPYYLLNSEREFERAVIEPFAQAYAAGRTPVPCVACNREVKFGSLAQRAHAWDAAVALRLERKLAVRRGVRREQDVLRRPRSPREWTIVVACIGSLAVFLGVPLVALVEGSLAIGDGHSFEAYRSHVVRPFFREHFARLDRQIVLVDVLAALDSGVAALAELEAALDRVLAAFRAGRNTILSRLFAPRIDRVLFAATKADHVHRVDHARLEAILRLLVERAVRRSEGAGANVASVVLASVRATREASVRRSSAIRNRVSR